MYQTYVIMNKLFIIYLVSFIDLFSAIFKKSHNCSEFPNYRKFMMLGLSVSIIGDVFIVWSQFFFVALAIFVVAQLMFIKAFAFKVWHFNTGLAMALAGFIMFCFVTEGLLDKTMKRVIMIYCAVLMFMVWRALVKWQDNMSVCTLFGAFGAFLFAISDFLLALDKFQIHVNLISFWVMLTYYIAHLLFALSVEYYSAPVPKICHAKKTQ